MAWKLYTGSKFWARGHAGILLQWPGTSPPLAFLGAGVLSPHLSQLHLYPFLPLFGSWAGVLDLLSHALVTNALPHLVSGAVRQGAGQGLSIAKS